MLTLNLMYINLWTHIILKINELSVIYWCVHHVLLLSTIFPQAKIDQFFTRKAKGWRRNLDDGSELKADTF